MRVKDKTLSLKGFVNRNNNIDHTHIIIINEIGTIDTLSRITRIGFTFINIDFTFLSFKSFLTNTFKICNFIRTIFVLTWIITIRNNKLTIDHMNDIMYNLHLSKHFTLLLTALKMASIYHSRTYILIWQSFARKFSQDYRIADRCFDFL